MLRSVAFLFLLLVCTYPAQAQRSLEKAISKRGDDVLVERNEKTGSAHRVYGLDVNAKKYIATINQESIPILAQAIFDDYAEILSINPRDIELTHIETADGMWFVSGNQIVDGVPIYGTEVGFTLNASGEIVLLGADVYPAVELPTNPSLSASAALAAAKAAFSETGTAEVKSEPRLTILPMGDPVNFYLTWQL